MKLEVVAFTGPGAALGRRLAGLPGHTVTVCAPQRFAGEGVAPLEGLADWVRLRFRSGSALVFIGSAGIAVRAIAPHVERKDHDPAVICTDEEARHVIPLLSGHLGGANRLARELADFLGAEAVLTTASDLRGVFAADAWAAENGCAVPHTAEIKHIAAALLDGELVGLSSPFPMRGKLPPGLQFRRDTRCGIEISLLPEYPYEHTLHLIPRCLVAGIGCRKDTPAATLVSRLTTELAVVGLPAEAVGAVATVDLKAEEPGLLELCRRLQAELRVYTAAELMQAEGTFTFSERVLQITGADNVCERAAVCAGGRLLTRKSGSEGVTVALAQCPWQICFEDLPR